MTKNEIANQITETVTGITRAIDTDYLLGYKQGDIITLENAESWTDGGHFSIENDKEYGYLFTIINEVPVHRVDYDNEEECSALGCEGCEGEQEVLIASGTKFKIVNEIDESYLDDPEDCGFVEIELEYIK